jgi:hypothetical protein
MLTDENQSSWIPTKFHHSLSRSFGSAPRIFNLENDNTQAKPSLQLLITSIIHLSFALHESLGAAVLKDNKLISEPESKMKMADPPFNKPFVRLARRFFKHPRLFPRS